MSQPLAPIPVEPIDSFFDKSGPLPPTSDDVRQYARFYYRSCAEATIYPLAAGSQQAPVRQVVLTRDLSRSGLSLLCNAQLFPGQRVDVVLDGQPPRAMQVAWCRRLSPQLYAAGCRFAGSGSATIASV